VPEYGSVKEDEMTEQREVHEPTTADEWVAQPQHRDELVREKTGRGWNEWVAAIAAGPGLRAGHTAIAHWLVAQGVDSWWAQAITVGVERICGMRLPGQMPDGTFTVSRSRVIAMSSEEFRALLLDEHWRNQRVPHVTLRLRSQPHAKALRFDVARDGEPQGVVSFTTDAAGAERTRLGVAHAGLASAEAAERWKPFWSDWLSVLSDSIGEAPLDRTPR
jgi:hypothetical protein